MFAENFSMRDQERTVFTGGPGEKIGYGIIIGVLMILLQAPPVSQASDDLVMHIWAPP